LTQYPWLVLLAAVLVGMLIMWLLELFILRRNVKRTQNDLEASLKKRDAELQDAQTNLTQTNAALKSKNDELQSTLNARAAADNQVADLKSQLAKTTTELDSTRQARQKAEATLTSTQAELDDTRAHQRGAVAEVAKLTAMAAATAATVKALETSKSDLSGQIETLNGELATTRAESEQLSSSLAETSAARASLESELDATKQRAGDLEGMTHALEGQVGELESKNSALDADVAKLTAGALAAAAVIKQLEGDKSALNNQHTQLQGEFEALQKAKALDDAELAELKLHLTEVNNALGITMRDKASYQQTLAARVGELSAAQTELTSVKQDNGNLLADVAKFSARAATAAALVQELESNKRDLNAQVEALRGELDAERQNAAALKPAGSLAPPTAPSETSDQGTREVMSAAGAFAIAAGASAAQSGDMPDVETTVVQPVVLPATDGGEPDEDALTYLAVCPQDMTTVHGIGAEFEQRLYNAGIGTYWDLSQRGEDELAKILELSNAQRAAVNLAAIRGDALRLARETKSQKRMWKGGVPDDFDMLIGIGRVYEGRLYEAGICTYEALSKTSVEQLAAICHAPQFNQEHYQSWIDQARVLLEVRRKGI
jgi:chromosome segregation ATPase